MRLLARLFPKKLRLVKNKLALTKWKDDDDSEEDADSEKDEESEAEAVDTVIELTDQETIQWLRLPYALTYYTIQGRTLRGKHILLEDTNNVHFTMRNLIVGMSRATDESLVHIA